MRDILYALNCYDLSGFPKSITKPIEETAKQRGLAGLGIDYEQIRRALNECPKIVEYARGTGFKLPPDYDIDNMKRPLSPLKDFTTPGIGFVPSYMVADALSIILYKLTNVIAADDYIQAHARSISKETLLSGIEVVLSEQYYEREILYRGIAYHHTVRCKNGHTYSYRDVLSDEGWRVVFPSHSTSLGIPESVLPGYMEDTLVWEYIGNKRIRQVAFRRSEIAAFLTVCLYHGHKKDYVLD